MPTRNINTNLNISGDVTATTHGSGENSTKIATTAYVKSQSYLTTSGKAADADKLDAQDGSYYLNYNNFTNKPTIPSLSGYATEAHVSSEISSLIGGAPGALDTLNELAAAINDDASYAGTITTALGTKAPLASPSFTGSPTAPTKSSSENSTKIATTAYVKSQGYLTSLGNALLKTGGTMSGKLTLSDTGYSLGDEFHQWKRSYSVNSSSAKEILYSDGNSLPNGGVYRFRAHISGTGTDQFATAVYWNQNGTWRVNVTGQSGTGSNHPEFIISASTNKPTIHHDHSGTYTVHILGERIELSEGTGTDNAGHGFGTDAFLGSVGASLYFSSGGTTATGVNPYDDGYKVFHDNYHPNADRLTIGRTITLGGDLSGSAEFTGAANITITAAVSNDSHTHTIANITSLQSSLNAKAALASPALTGSPTAPTQGSSENSTKIATTAFVKAQGYAQAGDENIIDGAASIWNADGDGDVFHYNDSNPTHNGKSTGAVLNIRGDGSNDHSLVRAGIFTSNHVSTANGYYVGTLLGTTNSTTTQVISGSGEWTGSVIPAAKLSTATTQASSENSTKIATTAFVKGQGYITGSGIPTLSGSNSFTNSYNEFGNSTGSVSNDGGWNARLNLAGSSHARFDVKSVSDGIISTVYAHSGHGAGRFGTMSNHKIEFMTGGNTKATLNTNSTFYLGSDRVFADNYHPNADRLTTGRTITLAGDLSGSAEFTGAANITITAAVNNDSHTHDGRYFTETEVTNHYKTLAVQGNFMNTYSWSGDTVGSADSGWGHFGSVPFSGNSGYGQNGTNAENTRAIATLPNGAKGVVWRTPSNDAASGADGGWNCNINGVDSSKAYRSVIYFRKTDDSNNGQFYHGCAGGHTLNINGSANTNPYFQSPAISTFVQDRWYVSIGYIQAYQSSGAVTGGQSGVYDCTTGKLVSGGSDFMMKSGSTTQTHRTYLYYSSDPNTSVEFYAPRFEELNGNEPSKQELINKGLDGLDAMSFHSKYDPEALTQLTESSDANDDKFLLWDESASVWKYMRLDDLQDSIDNNTTYTAGTALSLSGTTFNHSDTSSQSSSSNSGRTYIQSINLDGQGHVTGLSTATETVTNTNTTYSAGTGISLSGTTFSLTDTASKLSLSGGTMSGAINTNGSNIVVNGGTGLSTTGNETKFTTAHGYIELGPKNSSHAHIYTGSPNFYFNKELRVNGSTVWHSGNDGSGSGLDADKLDGVQASSFLRSDANDTVSGDISFTGGHGAINITNSSILSSATSNWTGNPGGAGKIQYHSNRWYIVSDSSSNRIVQFRRNSSDVSYIDNSGNFVGNVTGNASTATQTTKLAGFSQQTDHDLIRAGNANGLYMKARWDGTTSNRFWDMGYVDGNGTFYSGLKVINNGDITYKGNEMWHAGNDGSGSGLDADKLDGAEPSVYASNNTIVKRHSSGYIFANYFNTSPNTVTSGLSNICVEQSDDGYIRHANASTVRSFLNVANGANNYSLPLSSSSTRGGVKIGFTESGKNYPVELDSSEKMFVNVPWVDTNTDTNTTYSAGRGLDLSGTQFQLETDLRDSVSHIGLDSGDYIQWSNNSYFRGVVNGTERFRVNSSGSFGIGTSGPTHRLNVSGPNTSPNLQSSTVTSASLHLSNSDNAYGMYFACLSNGRGIIQQRRQTSTTKYDLLLQPYGGNVAVGRTSASTALHVSGTITNTVYNASNLPSASPAGQRAFAYHNYPLATAHGSVVSTNGSYVIPVYSDGSSWRAG